MAEVKKTRSELKREAIIVAAKAAFQEFGVQATSMDKLAEMAQVSKRTVYNHFATKEQLVMFLLTELWTESMVQPDVDYDPDAPLEGQLNAMLESEMDLLCSQNYMELSRVAIGHFFYDPESMRKEAEKFMAQETIFHRWIRAAMEDDKLVQLDVEFAKGQIHGLLKGFCFWPQLLKMDEVPDKARQRQIASEISKMFLARYAK